MSQMLVYDARQASLSWGNFTSRTRVAAEPRRARPRGGNAWLSAEEVADLLLAGEFTDAGVPVPSRFAPQAVESALQSVERWTREGRIFAIHELYPRYQFDSRGRPHPAIERALALLGAVDTLRVGNWFAGPNRLLGGKRPQELLATAPRDVLRALEHAAATLPGAVRARQAA